MTNDYYVFTVASSSMDNKLGHLQLNSKPKHMSQIWPKLWTDENFRKIKSNYTYNAFMVMDDESSYFCITTKWDVIHESGSCYDIEKQEAFEAYTYYGKDEQVTLSASEPNTYYGLRKINSNIQLSQFRINSKRLRDLDAIEMIVKWRYLCLMGTNQLYSSMDLCANPFNIEVLEGFVYDDQIYLFGTENVTSFPREVFTNIGLVHYFKVNRMENFFHCPSDNVKIIKPKWDDVSIFRGERREGVWDLFLLLNCSFVGS